MDGPAIRVPDNNFQLPRLIKARKTSAIPDIEDIGGGSHGASLGWNGFIKGRAVINCLSLLLTESALVLAVIM